MFLSCPHTRLRQTGGVALPPPAPLLLLPARRRLQSPRPHRRSLGRSYCQQNRPAPGPLDSLEAAVPRDQRPHRELKQLQEDPLFRVATLSLPQYAQRLAATWVGFFVLVGAPIAYQTFDFQQQPLEFVLSGALGAGVMVALAVLRVYLGWSYVGDRLLSATLAYEETGWYDGQTFVKPPEVLARDRLLGAYEVRPTLRRLKGTLLGTGAGLALCGGLLVGLVALSSDADGIYGRGAGRPAPRKTLEGIVFSPKVKSLADLANDDEAAEAEAAALMGMSQLPGHLLVYNECLYERPFQDMCTGSQDTAQTGG